MSQLTYAKVGLLNLKSIAKALENLGYKVEMHNKAVTLHGYEEDSKAHVIVRKNQLSPSYSDLGFLLKEDGTVQVIGESCFTSGSFLNGLKNEYALVQLQELAGLNGFFVGDIVKDGKTIKLTLENVFL